jgi:hypothetical protein
MADGWAILFGGPAMWYLIFFVFWIVVFSTARTVFQKWKQWRHHQPARYVSEVKSLRYFQSLTLEQFQQLVLQGLKRHGYTLLEDPFLTGSARQGYAWKTGKRATVAALPGKPVSQEDLNDVAIKQSRAHADRVLLFSPFPQALLPIQSGIEMIAGSKLLSWFSVLSAVRPPVSGKFPPQKCECGQPMEERVNRGGEPLFVCSRYPDCKYMCQPEGATAASGPRS